MESNFNGLIRIKKGSLFKGFYSGSGELELYGSFEGTLKVKSLYIKKPGIFLGFVSADFIIVEGQMNADIQAENLHLKSTGILDGEIIYCNLIIDSGGLLKPGLVQNISNIKNIIKVQKRV